MRLLLLSREIQHGGPFVVEGRVQVLWGPYRGILATIFDVAHRGGIGVEVHRDKQIRHRWGCSFEQLLRESP
jgi:hypothetical protein